MATALEEWTELFRPFLHNPEILYVMLENCMQGIETVAQRRLQ